MIWAIWSTRYGDIVVCSESRRMTICTSAATRARYMAPWPAELPPPTTAMRLPRSDGASVVAAP